MKIHYRDKVKVIGGFYRGEIGEVCDKITLLLTTQYMIKTPSDYIWVRKKHLKVLKNQNETKKRRNLCKLWI